MSNWISLCRQLFRSISKREVWWEKNFLLATIFIGLIWNTAFSSCFCIYTDIFMFTSLLYKTPRWTLKVAFFTFWLWVQHSGITIQWRHRDLLHFKSEIEMRMLVRMGGGGGVNGIKTSSGTGGEMKNPMLDPSNWLSVTKVYLRLRAAKAKQNGFLPSQLLGEQWFVFLFSWTPSYSMALLYT